MARLVSTLDALPVPGTYWIAYSGGLDSHVLLHLMVAWSALSPDFPPVKAVHVHHGLLADADLWTQHCRKNCDVHALPLTIVRVDARHRTGESPEEAARRARYQAIAALLEPGDMVLTAQHADDQAETLMLQLLRGAGLAGLSAMPERASLGVGTIVRPLLDTSRQDLLAYARDVGLSWIEDPSNTDQRYDRNYLRRTVMPLLEARWPAATRALGRSARHCAEAQTQLANLASDLYRTALLPDRSLSISRLEQFCEADLRLVLREWLRQSGFRMPSARTLERVLREMLPAATDKYPVVAWPEGEIRRYRDSLVLLRPDRRNDWYARQIIPWNESDPLVLPGDNGELEAVHDCGPGLDPDVWRTGRRDVRYRQGGELCRLAGRTGARCLKKLFQECGIPGWQRARIPLLYIDDQLAAVADLWVCLPFAVSSNHPAIRLIWHRPDIL